MKTWLFFDRFKFFVRKNSSTSGAVKLASETYVNAQADGDVTLPVLIMHGLFGSKAVWAHIARFLAMESNPRRKIIALDARNHGDSPHTSEHSYEHMSNDLLYFMQMNKIAKATVLGHSMGGRCAMYFSLTQPDKIEKLIVCDISPINNNDSQFSTIKFQLETMNQVKFPKDVSLHEAKNDVDKQLSVKIPKPLSRQFILTNIIQNEDGSFSWRFNLPVLVQNFQQNIDQFPNVEGKVFNGPVLFLIGEESSFVP
ncbi:hypothetical protein RN001_010562 [Aquatica leii]|uniref:sn-1-specific diacylglycerol lipase ABHD11 n=1 Tax=Aquatica leii TaxID=1421715 RepID=A0AAN7S8M3_9COLE|nr:hypothetical protein RN001_010562 [Aquatica leii]